MAAVPKEVRTREFVKNKKDPEDIFDSVTDFEARTLEEGYLKGLEEGREESAGRGFIVGFNTGSSIGLELSQAEGFCRTILETPPSGRVSNSSLLKLCEEVIEKVRSFPKTNVETEDVLEESGKIKALLDKVRLMITKKLPSETVVKQKYSI